MNPKRRQLIGMLGATAVAVAVPCPTQATPITNTFKQEDTPEERLEKFNQLTGLSLTLGAHWPTTEHGKFGERCLMQGDKHFTGPMNEETFRHWTAQVAFGYRIARGSAERNETL